MDLPPGNARAIPIQGENEDFDFIISDLVIEKWQRTKNLLAKSLHSTCGRISRALPNYFETLVSSSNIENTDKAGARFSLQDGQLNWYCKHVYDTEQPLRVNDSSKDLDDLGFVSRDSTGYGVKSYFGYPIKLPDSRVFGTICVEDGNTKNFGSQEDEILQEFKNIIEDDIRHLIDLFHYYSNLNQTNKLAEQLNEALSKGLANIKLSIKDHPTTDGSFDTVLATQDLQIEKLKEAIRQSLHINSHRMRGPLARILGLIRILNIKYSTNDEILSYLNKSANELDIIIHDIQNAVKPGI